MKPLEIDGTTLEGGGQLVRLSVGLAALTGTHIHIKDIRGGRSGGGGLKRQHLIAVQWLAEACNARTKGAELGSRYLEFEPDASPAGHKRKFKEKTASLPDGSSARDIIIDLASPGAVTLVLQAIFPYILFSTPSTPENIPKPVLLSLCGGTNCSASPSLDYIQQVTIPNLLQAGLPKDSIIPFGKTSRGYTHGSASVGSTSFLIQPLRAGTALPTLKIPSSQGILEKIDISVIAPGGFALQLLEKSFMTKIEDCFPGVTAKAVVYEDSRHWRRYYALLVAHTSSGFRLGVDHLHEGKVEKGDNGARNVIASIVKSLITDLADELKHEEALDHWMQDQVVVFQGLSAGTSNMQERAADDNNRAMQTLHTRTAKWIVSKLLTGASFDNESETCHGVGLLAGDARQRMSSLHYNNI